MIQRTKSIWKMKLQVRQLLLDNISDNFLKEVIGLSVNITLTEKNLSEIFKQEYPDVALPPQLFFTYDIVDSF